MTAPRSTADTAQQVADRLRARKLPPPWDVFGERVRKYEIHLSGGRVELVRGPVSVEGYGLRVLRPHDDALGAGFQSSTDLSPAGVARVAEEAESNAQYAKFPAKSVQLPESVAKDPSVEIADPAIWEDPAGSLQRHIAALQKAFESEPDASVTFGSVKAVLTETTLANSAGLEGSYAHTSVLTELGVLATGGPEGRAPGEYWVTGSGRQLETARLGQDVRDWARYARDARRTSAPPTGQIPVLFPSDLLDGVLPGALSVQFSGAGRLHEIAPAKGSKVGPDWLEVDDDGTVPWASKSGPFDDEGVAQQRRRLIVAGATQDLLCDLAHASAIGQSSTGSGLRVSPFGPSPWMRFVATPRPSTSTISIPGGSGGSDAELIETAQDGVYVQQMGWPSPDGATTAFGGEIRIGYRIRNGKLAEPVRGGTVGGRVIGPANEPSMFRDLIAVGRDPHLSGGVRVPSMLTRGLTVSGESSGA